MMIQTVLLKLDIDDRLPRHAEMAEMETPIISIRCRLFYVFSVHQS